MKIVKELRSKTKVLATDAVTSSINTSYQYNTVTVYVGAHGLTVEYIELQQLIAKLQVAHDNLQNYQCP